MIEQQFKWVTKMKYFNELPKIIVTQDNVSRVFTNILARTSIIQSIIKNPLLFYSYDIQESDTPEIIAHKYYGDVNRFWIVMISNQINDPQWDWPLTSSVFNQYLLSKYTEQQLTQVHHYEKIIQTTDNVSRQTTTETIVIDETTYDNLDENTTTYTLSSGTVTVQITKKIIDNFNYELNLNESKRNIKLLNIDYANQVEKEFMSLMSV